MNVTVRVWRQQSLGAEGRMVAHRVPDVSPAMSFLEMLDVLNEALTLSGDDDPVAFDSDCREGICGTCWMMINGPHMGRERDATCQLHMRFFGDSDEIDRAVACRRVPGDQGPRRRPQLVRPDHPPAGLSPKTPGRRPTQRILVPKDAPTCAFDAARASAAARVSPHAPMAPRCCSSERKLRIWTTSAGSARAGIAGPSDDQPTRYGRLRSLRPDRRVHRSLVCKGIPLDIISRLNSDVLFAIRHNRG